MLLHIPSELLSDVLVYSLDARACAPREMLLEISGGTADFDVFRYIGDAFKRCLRAAAARGEMSSRLEVELLFLKLNSHKSNPNLSDIYHALVLPSPKTFTWLGPDPYLPLRR
ncbi:hypothetical protein PHLGIDRAFT_123459 [Phlebiopsis gigantea 11061_1 CR5-6]|uniref:Uncharacterized protein n=1 Tax=Phlebiopsis gigantea (strain 11061_1 CR5-6) TaxID=745531 RepID=A0A0C3RYM0_PHLG1|nr:hypothetical protein PHLGIDRAFT_123459 [Phlebiopsis gigantea 11061_1 CR5-6]